jgi:hypothetical protein
MLANDSTHIDIFTPDGSPDASWQPTISNIATYGDSAFTMTGTQLNGLSEGANYGDDAEMASNYPIVRLTDSTGIVRYARTYNWSSTGVATGSIPESVQFTMPHETPAVNLLSVIANGIASPAVLTVRAGADDNIVVRADSEGVNEQVLDNGSLVGRFPRDSFGAITVLAASTGTKVNVDNSLPGLPVTLNENGADVFKLNAPTPTQQFVSLLYRDLLGRGPDGGGLSWWSSLLNEGKATRAMVAFDIQTSREYQTRQVDILYRDLLGRSPDALGLNSWLSFLAQGGTLAQVKTVFLSSDEYFQRRGGGTFDGFLTAVYADALDRDPDITGRLGWTKLYASGVSRTDIASEIVNSPELFAHQVETQYQLCLKRMADPGGLSASVNALEQGVPEQILIAVLVGSDEYFSRV